MTDEQTAGKGGLSPSQAQPLTGAEQFKGLPAVKVSDLWSWAYSDLRSNVVRSDLAEFLVATAVGADTAIPRSSWANYDVLAPDGVRIEVKSSGLLQSWWQARLSKTEFGRLTGREWDDETNVMSDDKRVRCDVYVFAVQTCQDPDAYDVLDVAQWEFYVVSASKVDAATVPGKVSLAWVNRNKSAGPVGFGGLAEAVRQAAPSQPPR